MIGARVAFTCDDFLKNKTTKQKSQTIHSEPNFCMIQVECFTPVFIDGMKKSKSKHYMYAAIITDSAIKLEQQAGMVPS